MNLLARFKQWRASRKDRLTAKLEQLRLEQIVLIKMGESAVANKQRYVASIICDMLEDTTWKVKKLENKLANM